MDRTRSSISSRRRWLEWLGAGLIGALAMQLLGAAAMRANTNQEDGRAKCLESGGREGDAQSMRGHTAVRAAGRSGESGSYGGSTACSDEDQEQVEAFRRGQSRELLGILRQRLAAQARSLPSTTPEGVVNGVTEYLLGMTQGIERAAPELVMAMSTEIESAICGGEQSADALMMYARMFRSVPALASAQSLDCFFAQRTAEDPVLWEGLDAWRGSELPAPKAVEALQAKAQLPQTRQRFMSAEELARMQAEPDPEPPLEPMETPPFLQPGL